MSDHPEDHTEELQTALEEGEIVDQEDDSYFITLTVEGLIDPVESAIDFGDREELVSVEYTIEADLDLDHHAPASRDPNSGKTMTAASVEGFHTEIESIEGDPNVVGFVEAPDWIQGYVEEYIRDSAFSERLNEPAVPEPYGL